MPGQVTALQRRIELLTPNYDRLAVQLQRILDDAPSAAAGEEARVAADKAARQASRVRAEMMTVGREIETLKALVAARLARSER